MILFKKLVPLYCSIKILTMKKKNQILMSLSDDEADLINAIRNYCDSYPNGYPQLLDYAQDLFEKLTDMPKD